MTDGPIIGIDLGGTNMQVGVVDTDDRIISRVKKKTRAADGDETVIERIVEAAASAALEAGIGIDSISAVGIVAPGAIDVPNGVVLEAPNLGWNDIPLRDRMRERLGRPVVVDNDVNGAIVGEYHFGAGRGSGDALGVWVGTGVGGGLILCGELYQGTKFTAGEIGQTVVLPDGPVGARILEDFSSRTGMSRIIQRNLPAHPESMLHDLTDSKGRVTGSKKLASAYEQGDVLATKIVERAAELLGVAIANQVTMLSLDQVIIGGGVTEALGERFLGLIRESFDASVFPKSLRDCELVITQLEADAGVLGAAVLARNAREACCA